MKTIFCNKYKIYRQGVYIDIPGLLKCKIIFGSSVKKCYYEKKIQYGLVLNFEFNRNSLHLHHQRQKLNFLCYFFIFYFNIRKKNMSKKVKLSFVLKFFMICIKQEKISALFQHFTVYLQAYMPIKCR